MFYFGLLSDLLMNLEQFHDYLALFPLNDVNILAIRCSVLFSTVQDRWNVVHLKKITWTFTLSTFKFLSSPPFDNFLDDVEE